MQFQLLCKKVDFKWLKVKINDFYDFTNKIKCMKKLKKVRTDVKLNHTNLDSTHLELNDTAFLILFAF